MKNSNTLKSSFSLVGQGLKFISPLMWFNMAVNVAAFWGPIWFFRNDPLVLQFGKAFAISIGTSILCSLLFGKQIHQYHLDAFAQILGSIKPSRKQK